MKPSLSVQKPVNAPAGVVSAQGIAKYHTQRPVPVYDGYGYHLCLPAVAEASAILAPAALTMW